VGGGIAAHGAQKAFGAFEGPGPQGAAAFLESLGFSPGDRYASAASWTELGSGTLIALGLGGPLGPAHAKNGFFAQNNGIELGTVYSAGALALASAGFGRFSLDEVLGWEMRRAPWLTVLAIAGGIAAGCLIVTQRTQPEPAPAPPAAADEDTGPFRPICWRLLMETPHRRRKYRRPRRFENNEARLRRDGPVVFCSARA
jgi:putative oxidoreductase